MDEEQVQSVFFTPLERVAREAIKRANTRPQRQLVAPIKQILEAITYARETELGRGAS